MNGEALRVYVERTPVSELLSNDIVIMDNLSAHKVAGVRQAIEGAGARRHYLPPYSTALNTIKVTTFSKLKACTVDALWQSLGRCAGAVYAEECRHFFEAAGYGQG